MPKLAPCLAALAAAFLLALPAVAAPGYSVRAVAIEGDSAPGTGDDFGSFQFVPVRLNDAGEVAFVVPLASGFPASGGFVDAGSGPVLRIRDGDASPPPWSTCTASSAPSWGSTRAVGWPRPRRWSSSTRSSR